MFDLVEEKDSLIATITHTCHNLAVSCIMSSHTEFFARFCCCVPLFSSMVHNSKSGKSQIFKLTWFWTRQM